MRLPGVPILLLVLWLAVGGAFGDNQAGRPSSPPPKLTKENRFAIIRSLNSELVYIHTLFPQGLKGLTLKNGMVSPNVSQVEQMVANFGPAARPGDRARISSVEIKSKSIRFEINGGPRKKTKWYQRIQVSGMGGTVQPGAPDPNANPRGSVVDLEFDNYVPDLTPDRVKQLLAPVFDFHSKSAAEAYMETVPPQVREAIKDHKVLVGMNREMVTYAKGRPPKRIREKDEHNVNYEEWIYGEPPQPVEFVRLVGDEVVRVETMTVDGKKEIRTAKEVNLPKPASVAEAEPKEAQPVARPAHAPTLRRPGEGPKGQPEPTTVGAPPPLPPVPGPPQPPQSAPQGPGGPLPN